MLAGTTVPLLTPPPPIWQAQVGCKSVLSMNLANTVLLAVLIHSDTAPRNLHWQAQPLPATFPYKPSALAHAADFPKISEGSPNLKQVGAGHGILCTTG